MIAFERSMARPLTLMLGLAGLAACHAPVDLSDQCGPANGPCWTTVGSPGLRVVGIAESVNGLIVAAGTSQDLLVQPGDRRVYRLDESSQTWIEVLEGPWAAAAVAFVRDPSGTGRFLVGSTANQSSSAIHLSDNGGVDWVPVAGAGWAFVLAVDPTDSSVILRGGVADIHMSTDGGDTWQTVYGSLESAGLGVRVVTFASHEEGATWATVRSPFDETYVLKSADRGATWSNSVVDSVSGTPRAVSDILVDPNDLDHVWLLVGPTLIESDDGGASWHVTGQLPGSGGFALAGGHIYIAGRVHDEDASTLMLLRYDSENRGWLKMSVPSLSGATAVATGLNGSLLIGTQEGLYRFRP